jgi:hypothetical protein
MTTNTDTQKLLEALQEFLDEISAIQNQLTIPGILGKFPDDDQKRQFKQFVQSGKDLLIKLVSILLVF